MGCAALTPWSFSLILAGCFLYLSFSRTSFFSLLFLIRSLYSLIQLLGDFGFPMTCSMIHMYIGVTQGIFYENLWNMIKSSLLARYCIINIKQTLLKNFPCFHCLQLILEITQNPFRAWHLISDNLWIIFSASLATYGFHYMAIKKKNYFRTSQDLIVTLDSWTHWNLYYLTLIENFLYTGIALLVNQVLLYRKTVRRRWMWIGEGERRGWFWNQNNRDKTFSAQASGWGWIFNGSNETPDGFVKHWSWRKV